MPKDVADRVFEPLFAAGVHSAEYGGGLPGWDEAVERGVAGEDRQSDGVRTSC